MRTQAGGHLHAKEMPQDTSLADTGALKPRPRAEDKACHLTHQPGVFRQPRPAQHARLPTPGVSDLGLVWACLRVQGRVTGPICGGMYGCSRELGLCWGALHP